MFVILKKYNSFKPRMEILCCNESIKNWLNSEYVFVEFRFENKINATIFFNIESAEIALKEIEILESCIHSSNSFEIVPLNELQQRISEHFSEI